MTDEERELLKQVCSALSVLSAALAVDPQSRNGSKSSTGRAMNSYEQRSME